MAGDYTHGLAPGFVRRAAWRATAPPRSNSASNANRRPRANDHALVRVGLHRNRPRIALFCELVCLAMTPRSYRLRASTRRDWSLGVPVHTRHTEGGSRHVPAPIASVGPAAARTRWDGRV